MKRTSPFWRGRVLADPADEHVVASGGRARRRELLDFDPGSAGEDRRRLLGRERVRRLEPDRLGVADEDGHPHAGRAHRQDRQLQDLSRLLAQFLLFLELDAVEAPVHAQVVVLGRLGAELLHCLGTGARDGLVGGDPDALEPGRVVQGLERARERDRTAVRVGDDAVVLGGADAVHLGHHERNARLEAERRRLVDADGAALDGDRDELAARLCADREETEIDVARRQRLGSRLLDHGPVEHGAGRARAREQAQVAVAALMQELHRDGADGSRRADDADAGVRRPSQARTPGAGLGRRGRRRSRARDRRS